MPCGPLERNGECVVSCSCCTSLSFVSPVRTTNLPQCKPFKLLLIVPFRRYPFLIRSTEKDYSTIERQNGRSVGRFDPCVETERNERTIRRMVRPLRRNGTKRTIRRTVRPLRRNGTKRNGTLTLHCHIPYQLECVHIGNRLACNHMSY